MNKKRIGNHNYFSVHDPIRFVRTESNLEPLSRSHILLNPNTKPVWPPCAVHFEAKVKMLRQKIRQRCPTTTYKQTILTAVFDQPAKTLTQITLIYLAPAKLLHVRGAPKSARRESINRDAMKGNVRTAGSAPPKNYHLPLHPILQTSDVLCSHCSFRITHCGE